MDITLGRFVEEFVVPATTSFIGIIIQGGGSGTSYYEVMQMTLINLTRLGYPTTFPPHDPRA